MESFVVEKLTEMLKVDEGFKGHPYKCTEDVLTIGYGRNLEERGITQQEAEVLLKNDVSEVIDVLERKVKFFRDLCSARRVVLCNMCFQLGFHGLMKFRRMLAALERKDFDAAAEEMLDSKWANQTPRRAHRLYLIMKSGRLD